MFDCVLLHRFFVDWEKHSRNIFSDLEKKNDVYSGLVKSRTNQSWKNIAF